MLAIEFEIDQPGCLDAGVSVGGIAAMAIDAHLKHKFNYLILQSVRFIQERHSGNVVFCSFQGIILQFIIEQKVVIFCCYKAFKLIINLRSILTPLNLLCLTLGP